MWDGQGMATLEQVRFTPMREIVKDKSVTWSADGFAKQIERLPQIFWSGGEPWSEANHWALSKAVGRVGRDMKTVTSLMKHLASYASWLEATERDWRHFPMRMADRAIVLYRGHLIAQRDAGDLMPSTATARMNAVIQFYRHARHHGFVNRASPMWTDKQVLVRYHDTVGFERTLLRTASELAIPNRARPGSRLEDGLTPLRSDHAEELLRSEERRVGKEC